MYHLLKGVRIVDLTSVLFGPMATQILGDLGADIIKVELPEGDVVRAVPPHGAPGIGPVFANVNRNKRCICLDLKTDGGKQVLRALLKDADLFVHNMRRKAIERLGFGFEDVSKVNPEIIYCAALGFGSQGPNDGKPAYDDIIQAASGLAGSHQMRDGEPIYAAGVTADKVGALHVTYAMLAALYDRERNGRKAMHVEVPMFESLVSFVMYEHLGAASFERDGGSGYHRTLSANRRPYKTADSWVGVLPYTGAHWTRVLNLIGRDDIMATDWFGDATERSRRNDELYGILRAATPKRTTAEWLAAFTEIDVPCSPVNTLDDLLEDAHLEALDYFEPNFSEDSSLKRSIRQPAIFHGFDTAPDLPPQPLGAQTAAILEDLGFTAEEIDTLAQAGAVKS